MKNLIINNERKLADPLSKLKSAEASRDRLLLSSPSVRIARFVDACLIPGIIFGGLVAAVYLYKKIGFIGIGIVVLVCLFIIRKYLDKAPNILKQIEAREATIAGEPFKAIEAQITKAKTDIANIQKQKRTNTIDGVVFGKHIPLIGNIGEKRSSSATATNALSAGTLTALKEDQDNSRYIILSRLRKAVLMISVIL